MEGFDPLALLAKPEYVALFAHGLEMTFVIAAGSWLLGMLVAVLLLAGRMTASRPLGIFVITIAQIGKRVDARLKRK